MDSRSYSWAWVTSDQLLTEKPAELVSATLVPSAATTDSAIYNGRNASGDKVIGLKRATVDNLDFAPPVPIYCDKGIYVDVGTSVTGILVQWRAL